MHIAEDEAKKILDFIASRAGYDEFEVVSNKANTVASDTGFNYIVFLSKRIVPRQEMVVQKKYGLSMAFHCFAFSYKPTCSMILNAMIEEMTNKTYELCIRKADGFGWQPLLMKNDTIDTLRIEADLRLKSSNQLH